MKIQLLIVSGMISISAFAGDPDSAAINAQDSLDKKVFHLGEVTITASDQALMTDRLTHADMETQNTYEVSTSLNVLPGIFLTASGTRNESTVSVRGFDLRSVPVYMDGIPVYVPYDGYVDLARFTTFDLSRVDVSKGFSSMLYGPNALGGAINLISRKPEEKLEYDGSLGILNTDGIRGNVNFGANTGKFYFQGGYSYLHRNTYILSKDFTPHPYEDGGNRENAYRTDQKINLKLGWTPDAMQEYALGYINQQGQKGNPVYAGDDTLNSLYAKPRYWQWPSWDKETYYFLSNTRLNTRHYIKTRVYYDIFRNALMSFDDSTYTTQAKPYAFQSRYNDYTYGGSMEYGTTILPKNELKISAHFKKDVHREHDLNEPERRFEDNTTHFALEDVFTVNSKFIVVPGLSFSSRNNVMAEDYNSAADSISDFAQSGPSAALNGQLGAFYYLNNTHKISFTLARKTRFATIKDRYSYRMGTAIPNPDLKPETSDNFDLTYSGVIFKKLSCQASFFYSHLTDAILNVSNVEPGKSQMQNTGEAEFAGMELAAQYDLYTNLSIYANYTYLERRNLTNPDVLFTDVPNSKVFSYVQYKPAKFMSVLLASEYNSMRYSTSYGTQAPGFILFNAIIAANVWKSFSIEAGVNNIFDKNYMLTEGFPEEGRNFFLTLRFFNSK